MTPELFTQWYEANYVDVLRFVKRRAHPLLVDDVVAETFAIAWRRRLELPDNARPWLFGTARNVLLNAGRKEQRQAEVAIQIGHIVDPTSFEVGSLLDLTNALRSLSSADQEVLALQVWDRLPTKEAAEVLGISRASYTMRLTRARRRLTALIGPEGFADAISTD